MKFSYVWMMLIGASTACLSAQENSGSSNALAWRIQQLHKDNNEGVAVGDIDGDGKPDITAGEFWYQAPSFKQRPLRKLESFGADYLQNNSEHLWDIDHDGDLDVISGGFTLPVVNWFENPGVGNYDSLWKSHQLVNTGTKQNEATFLNDLDGNGIPEFIVNSWNNKSPMLIFQLVHDGDVSSTKRHPVAESGNGHGMGFGDINGDGKLDIVFQRGWYQQPDGGAFSGTWKLHDEFDLPHASCPIIVFDLNGDDKNDLIWANGHNYGLYWQEQLERDSNGTTTWRKHLIDRSFSQGHCLAWEDIDNDGKPELITGKRYHAHSGKDPGAKDEITVQYYDWSPENRSWTKHNISSAAAGQGPGVGLQIRVHDLDGDTWKDIVVAGKSGTHILWNNGFSEPKSRNVK